MMTTGVQEVQSVCHSYNNPVEAFKSYYYIESLRGDTLEDKNSMLCIYLCQRSYTQGMVDPRWNLSAHSIH